MPGKSVKPKRPAKKAAPKAKKPAPVKLTSEEELEEILRLSSGGVPGAVSMLDAEKQQKKRK